MEQILQKDNRNRRFKRTNFKKRDNKREQAHIYAAFIERLEQSFSSRFGNKYEGVVFACPKEQQNLIQQDKKVPKKNKSFFKEYPITLQT